MLNIKKMIEIKRCAIISKLKENICVILAVYSNNTLQYVSDIQYKTIAPFSEKTVVFGDVSVDENSSVKVMCFTDIANISPVCEPAVLSNAE